MQLQSKSSRALSAVCQTAAKCTNSKNALAILDCILLTRREDGQFLFTTSTSDSQLTIPAPLSLIDGKYTEPLALPVSGIISYLATLPDCTVNITFNDNKTLTLDYCTGSDDKVKTGKVSLPYFDGKEFPIISGFTEEKSTHITLPSSLFMKAVKQAKIFSAQDELRPVLNSLCVDISDDLSQCMLVSTNGHTLIKFTHSNDPKNGGSNFYRSGHPCKINIHNSYFRSITAFAGCEDIDIEFDGNFIRISSGDSVFVCKAIEGGFPNYNSVIPKNNPSFICFDKKEMLSVIKRVSIFGSESSKLIKLQKDGLFVTLKAENVDFSTYAEDQVVLLDSQCREDFVIGFNSLYFANIIGAINSDIVRMQMNEVTSPCIFTSDTPSPTVLTLCMPTLFSD